jgi:hypothetical protein
VAPKRSLAAMEAAAARRAAHSEGEWKLMRGDLAMLSGATGCLAVRRPWSPAGNAEDMRGAMEPNAVASTTGSIL